MSVASTARITRSAFWLNGAESYRCWRFLWILSRDREQNLLFSTEALRMKNYRNLMGMQALSFLSIIRIRQTFLAKTR